MATFHSSKNDLKIKYEKLKHNRLLTGKIVFVALIIISSVALLYAILDPQGLREWIKTCYWAIAPDGGGLSDLVCLIMAGTQGLIYVVWLAAYPLLIYIICSSVSRLRKQDFGKMTEEEAILKAGVEGEEKVRSILAQLPDCCYVYTNINIPWRDRNGNQKNSETDAIVLSSSGIFIVEVKNYRGYICGRVSDENLTQEKYRGEKLIAQKSFYNPIKQVKTHTRALTSYLRENGMKCNVGGCVFFCNEDVELRIDGETGRYSDCPVFTVNMQSSFFGYLYSKYSRAYSDEEVMKIRKIMDRLAEMPINSN